MPDTTATAFLFVPAAMGDPIDYGTPCNRAFFRALLKSDPQNCTESFALYGDLLHHNEAYKLEALSHGRDDRGHITTSQIFKADKGLFALIVWEMSETLTEGWSTVSEPDFPFLLAEKSIYCIICPTIQATVRQRTDSILQKRCRGYVGAVEVDPGNPLHRTVFFNNLFKDLYVRAGNLYLRREFDAEDDPLDIHSWSQVVPFGARISLESGDYAESAPPYPDGKCSERGRRTAELLAVRGRPTHHQQVAAALSELVRGVGHQAELKFDAHLPEGLQEVYISEQKLTAYALNPDHPVGGPKAKLFRELLGLEAADWRYLAAQITTGLGRSDIRKVRQSEFGIQYEADVPVQGRNGETKLVRTAWIAMSGEPARLVTLYLAPPGIPCAVDVDAPPLLPDDVQGDERWAALFELAKTAGHLAEQSCVPTPMIVSSGWGQPTFREIVPDGACGGAFVVVPDARKGFARWLRKCGKGSPWRRSGQIVYAESDSQSLEKAAAYANAFAGVLFANGVPSSVVTYKT